MSKRPYWQKCKNGKLLRAVMAEVLPRNALILWGANRRVDDAGKRYCTARCGGCPLTEGYPPPEDISRAP